MNYTSSYNEPANTFLSKRYSGNSIKQLKHCLALAIREIKNLACSLDANKALGFALCFISISATRLVLYFTYSTRGNALTYIYIYICMYIYTILFYAM